MTSVAQIKMALAATGQTQAWLAVQSGITQEGISRIFKGVRSPRAKTLEALARPFLEMGFQFSADADFEVVKKPRSLLLPGAQSTD